MISGRDARIAAMLIRRANRVIEPKRTAADYFVVDARTDTADLVRLFDQHSDEATALRWSLMTSETDWSTPSGVKGLALAAA